MPQVDIYKFGRSVRSETAINIEAGERAELELDNGSSPAEREIRAGGNSEEIAATQGRQRWITEMSIKDLIKTFYFIFLLPLYLFCCAGKGVTGVIVVNGDNYN